MIQLSTLPPTGIVPGVRAAGFPLGTTSDFALALADLAGAPGGIAMPATPPIRGVVATLPGPAPRHAVAADGKDLPTDAIDAPVFVPVAMTAAAATPVLGEPSGHVTQPLPVIAPPATSPRAVEAQPAVVAASISYDPVSPDPLRAAMPHLVSAHGVEVLLVAAPDSAIAPVALPGVETVPAPKSIAKKPPEVPPGDMPMRARHLPREHAAMAASPALPDAPQPDVQAECDSPTPRDDRIDAPSGTVDLALPTLAVSLPLQPAPVATTALPTAPAAETTAASAIAPVAAATVPVSSIVTQPATEAAPVSRVLAVPDGAGQPAAATPAALPVGLIHAPLSDVPAASPAPVAMPVNAAAVVQPAPATALAPIETPRAVRSRPMPASTSPTTTAAIASPRKAPVPQVDGAVVLAPAPPSVGVADLTTATADRIAQAMAPVPPVVASAPAVAGQPMVSTIDSAAKPAPGFVEIAPPLVAVPVVPQAAVTPPQPANFAPSPAPSESVRVADRAAPVAVTVVTLPAVPPPTSQLQPAAQLFAAAMFAAAAPAESIAKEDALPLTAVSGFAAAATSAPTIAVSAPAQGQAPTLDMTKDDWMASMIDRIETLRDESGGVRETRMRLAPEALGSVEVSVRRDEAGVLQVRISADTPQARAMLTEAAPKLAEMAEARGVKLGGSSVDSGSSSAEHGRRDASTPAQRRAPTAAAGDTKDVDDSRLA